MELENRPVESGRGAEYAIHFRVRFHLPKLQDRFRVVFEDEDSDNIFYDSLKLDNQYRLENKGYFLRLDYLNYVIERLDFTSGVGLKFKRLNIYPYINLKARYIFDDNRILLKNRFRIYSDGEYRDTVTFSKVERFGDDSYIIFRNFIRYRSSSRIRSMVNSLSVTNRLSNSREITYGFLLKEHFKVYRYYFDYPQYILDIEPHSIRGGSTMS